MQQPRRGVHHQRKLGQARRSWSIEGFYLDGKNVWELLKDSHGKTKRRKI